MSEENKKFEVGDDGNGLKNDEVSVNNLQCPICKKWAHIDFCPEDFSSIKLTKKCRDCEKKETPPLTDFKIAEIWIRDGRLMLEASKEFWLDKFRARGILKYCDDIVKEAEYRDDKIVKPSSWNNFRNFVRGIKRRK